MAKDDIKQLVEGSKKAITQDKEGFADSIRQDLEAFKKKTLGNIGA